MLPVSFAALGAGILFSSYNIALARNPEEKDNLFSGTIMWFAFIESFVFIGLAILAVGFFAVN